MKILVTGAAGFIGFHVAKACIARGDIVVGYDNVNDYYDVNLKKTRLQILAESSAGDASGSFTFIRGDLENYQALSQCFQLGRFDRVIHLAAQAGVRYSLENPRSYVDSNVVGFLNVLEACKESNTPHLTYASTSSVYGANTNLPFAEHQGVDHPLQLYAATKRANELMAHSYSNLFMLPTTGLRFFTVYGPWGRPDMALFKFTKNIIEGKPIDLYNNGEHTRDFTYVADIVNGITIASDDIASPDAKWDSASPNPGSSNVPFRIFNIGNSSPVQLMEYVEAIETAVGTKARKNFLPIQPGDVPDTHCSSELLEASLGYRPTTQVREGVARFVEWFKDYYGV